MSLVKVICTSRRDTRLALNEAARLCRDSAHEIQLIVPVVVPYCVPIDAPVVPVTFTADWISKLLQRFDHKVRVTVCPCRDTRIGLLKNVAQSDLVLIGGAKYWWRSRAQRLADWLDKQGINVLFITTNRKPVKEFQ